MTSRARLVRVQSPLGPSAANDLVRKADLPATILKTATESVTSSLVLQNDDELLLAMLASTKYALDGVLFFDGAVGGGFKTAFTVPSGATIKWNNATADVDAAPPGSYDSVAVTSSGTSEGYACIGAGTTQAAQLKGTIVVAGTAGNLQLQWAQVVSSGTATRVFLDSWMILTKIG